MDLAKLGGRAFMLGLFGLAAIDGMFLLFCMSLAVGAVVAQKAYHTSKANSLYMDQITRQQIEEWAASDTDEETGVSLSDEQKEHRQHQAKHLLSELEKQTKLESHGNATAAKLMGLGAFASPITGLAGLAYYVRVSQGPQDLMNSDDEDKSYI